MHQRLSCLACAAIVLTLFAGQLLGIAPAAGDANDPDGPTYATFASLTSAAPAAAGALLTQRVDRAGQVTNDAGLAQYSVTAAHRVQVPGLDHQIASPFWTFMN